MVRISTRNGLVRELSLSVDLVNSSPPRMAKAIFGGNPILLNFYKIQDPLLEFPKTLKVKIKAGNAS
jgi:hypothetical protein